MAANPPAPGPWIAPPPPAPWGPGRVIAVVIGAVLLLPALGLLVGGGLLLWADGPARDDDGYLYSAEETFSTTGYAMVSENIDLAAGAGWVPVFAALGTTRVEISGTGDVFVGIAPLAEGQAYLAGVERTVIADLGIDTTAADHQLLPGGAPSGPPTSQDFWVAEASGSGTQQLSWEPADGNWLLVVMNADGSSEVSVDARVGATIPALTGLGWGVLGGGLVLVLIASVVLLLAALRRPAAPAGPAYRAAPGPVPGGPPPGWAPPAPVDRTSAADSGAPTPTDATHREPQGG
jgi:hypothetical protein